MSRQRIIPALKPRSEIFGAIDSALWYASTMPGGTTIEERTNNGNDIALVNGSGVITGDGFIHPGATTYGADANINSLLRPDLHGQIIVSFTLGVSSTTAGSSAPMIVSYGRPVNSKGGWGILLNDTSGNKRCQFSFVPENGAKADYVAGSPAFSDTNDHVVTFDWRISEAKGQFYLDGVVDGAEHTIANSTSLGDRTEGMTFMARNNGIIDKYLGSTSMTPRLGSLLIVARKDVNQTLALAINSEMTASPFEIPSVLR